jgi:hypothetical protein
MFSLASAHTRLSALSYTSFSFTYISHSFLGQSLPLHAVCPSLQAAFHKAAGAPAAARGPTQSGDCQLWGSWSVKQASNMRANPTSPPPTSAHTDMKTDRISDVYAFVQKSALLFTPLHSPSRNFCPRAQARLTARDGAVCKERLGGWDGHTHVRAGFDHVWYSHTYSFVYTYSFVML